jgi:hypothetical protein
VLWPDLPSASRDLPSAALRGRERAGGGSEEGEGGERMTGRGRGGGGVGMKVGPTRYLLG